MEEATYQSKNSLSNITRKDWPVSPVKVSEKKKVFDKCLQSSSETFFSKRIKLQRIRNLAKTRPTQRLTESLRSSYFILVYRGHQQ